LPQSYRGFTPYDPKKTKKKKTKKHGEEKHPSVKVSGFPPPRHPGNFQAGVHSIEKPKKKQKHGCLIKDFGNDSGRKSSTRDSTYSFPLP